MVALRVDEPVEEVAHDLQQAIPRILSEVGVPGASVTLIRDAQCAWSGGFGAKNAQTREPVTTETVFEAYSCTKPLVAFRALQMCEDGSLELDTPLIHYLADPFVPEDARTELITLRMALSHTSGLPDDEDQRSIRFTPGDRWSYSTVGYYYVQ